MEVIEYKKEYQPIFKDLNLEWLNKYFKVEPIDTQVLGDPENYIIKPGGFIYFVKYNGEIIATAAIRVSGEKELELTKMAVDPNFHRLGAGKFLCAKMIEKAKQTGCERLILYSNRRLNAAIHIYKKLGFIEIPLEEGIYERADIKMEIVFA